MRHSIWSALWQREWQLKWRNAGGWLQPLVFFIMVLVLFPLAAGANMGLLTKIGVAAVWIAALLSVLLGLESLFRSDLDDGTLEQIITARRSLALWALLKIALHWLTGGFILTGLSVLSMPLFNLTAAEEGILSLSLLLGTPILTLLGAVAAALTVSLRGHNLLIPLIALPLQLPILIFACGAVDLMRTGGNPYPVLILLLGLLILALVFIPFALAAALRLAVQH